MSDRGSHHKLNSRRSVAVAGVATVLATTLLAPPTYAWDYDPHVILKGGGGCRQLFYQATAVQFFLENGESPSSAFSKGSYRVDFYNIPGTPLNGVAGYALVECSNVFTPAAKYYWARGINVSRPRIGNTQTLNLGGG